MTDSSLLSASLSQKTPIQTHPECHIKSQLVFRRKPSKLFNGDFVICILIQAMLMTTLQYLY